MKDLVALHDLDISFIRYTYETETNITPGGDLRHHVVIVPVLDKPERDTKRDTKENGR